MPHRPEVVVVDGLPETAQVLRAVLEPRGLSVSRRTSRQLSADDAETTSRVLVLHDATDPAIDGPCVIVGRFIDRSPAARHGVHDDSTGDDRRSLPVPFHYGDLVAAINAVMPRAA